MRKTPLAYCSSVRVCYNSFFLGFDEHWSRLRRQVASHKQLTPAYTAKSNRYSENQSSSERNWRNRTSTASALSPFRVYFAIFFQAQAPRGAKVRALFRAAGGPVDLPNDPQKPEKEVLFTANDNVDRTRRGLIVITTTRSDWAASCAPPSLCYPPPSGSQLTQ